MPNAIHFKAEFSVPHPVHEVWPYLANTDSLNRAFGFPPVSYAPAVDADGVRILEARATYKGVPMRWHEYPFTWRENEEYAVRRVFQGGPIAEIVGQVKLESREGGTAVLLDTAITPRNLLGTIVAHLAMGPTGTSQFRSHCQRITRVLNGLQKDAFPRPRDPFSVERERLERKLQAVAASGVDAALIQHLRTHLEEANDEHVTGMRPFALADAWGADRRATLGLFLHATSQGALELAWSVLCPNCRVSKADYSTLRELKATAHCETCDIDFDVDFDRLVELRFDVHPQVRVASSQIFCIGGPRNTPHVIAQDVLAPGASVLWRAPDAQEVLRVRARERSGGVRVYRDAAGEGGEVAAVRFTKDDVQPGRLLLADGTRLIEVSNQSEQVLHIMLERESWPTDAVSAALVSTLPEFRRLFSAEVLAPNLHVGIRSVALLFTDLKGSTAFYQEVGDASAFGVVRDHFAILDRIVSEHQGTFVKTMGDAIMAAFMCAHDAMRAAVAMRSAIGTWNDPRVPEPATFLKLGVHQGPVISVNLSDRLDYFGTTVNMAARVQHQSEGGDIVMSGVVHEDPEVARLLAAEGLQPEPFMARLSGFTEPLQLWRIPPRSL